MFFNQEGFDVRCEWGGTGIAALLPDSDVIVIVDVLSFSTCVDVAVGNGAIVYPYRWQDASALAYATSRGALLASASRTCTTGYFLAPTSLARIPAGTRLVLPSPNGATLTLATGTTPTFAGCLRNASAVAHAAQAVGGRISVIPAGERWADGNLRPAIEDLIGAGAIIHHLIGTRSPEAAVAEQAFLHARSNLADYLRQCGSGRELIGRGFAGDVE
ncbi:MAG TPA: 2-phosphosulfolactate phosphatase, partial [Chthoniobacterales bacterium]